MYRSPGVEHMLPELVVAMMTAVSNPQAGVGFRVSPREPTQVLFEVTGADTKTQ